MIDWDGLVTGPIYSVYGIPASLTVGASTHAVTVIDQTAGIEIEAGLASMPTIKPAAMIRVSELSEKSIDSTALVDALLTFGGNVWTVKNVAPKPGPDGKGTGEMQLILINGDL